MTAKVIEKSWGWVVVQGQIETIKIGSHIAAQQLADRLNAGESFNSAWEALNISQHVRVKDGGLLA